MNASHSFGDTPLHFAVKDHNVEIANLLNENCALLNKKNIDGYTSMEWTLEESNYPALRMLMYDLTFQPTK